MVPNGWKLTSLGNISSKIQTGPFGSQLHAHEYTDEGIPVLMPKNLINNRADIKSAAKIPKSRADDLAKHKLKKDDILFSRRGDVARFGLITEESEGSLCGTGCLKASINQKHSALFLSYFLQKSAVRKWLEQNAVGQTMLNLNTTILSELPIMVCSSKREEEKIAKILSTWDKAISTTERLIENSTQQKKALMQQLLTGKKRLIDESGKRFKDEWEAYELSKICSINKGKQINRSTLSDTGPYPVINGGITPSGYTESSNTQANTITISEGGNSCGFVGFQNEDFWCGGHCYALQNVQINNLFLYQFLKFIERKVMTLRVGSGLPNIQKKEIETVKILVPRHEEQQKIASVLTNADKEIELLQQQLADLQQEKKALMQQLLTGKRRVKVEVEQSESV